MVFVIFGIYCMRDARTSFMTPTIDVNDAAAVRNFESAMMQSGSVLCSHPNDFSLYKIGEYDNEKGAVFPMVPIQHLAEGSSVILGKGDV